MINHKTELEKAFSKVRATLQKANGDKVVFNSLLERSEGKRKTWAKDIIDREQSDLTENLKVTMQNHWLDISQAFESARESARKRLDYLDVNDDSLVKALKLIEVMGSNLTEGKVNSINEQFRGKQGALSALKSAYKKAGVTGGLIDTMLYRNFENEWDSARRAVLGELNPEGYLNASAQAIKRLADLEGVDFDPVIDKSEIHSMGQLESMTVDDINANWHEVSKFLTGTGGGE
jgi:hypothetical protein